jgi:hypothetical protein
MLHHATASQLEALGFHGMAKALAEQINDKASLELSFEDRLAMLVDREAAWRETKRYQSRLRPKFKIGPSSASTPASRTSTGVPRADSTGRWS